MDKFFKSKFFIIVLIIALAMVIVPSILTSMGLSNVVEDGVSTVLLPVQKLFGYAANGLRGYADYFTEYDRLAEENAELKSELARIQDKVYTADELERMNDWLYDYLELKREHTDFTLVPANVTGRGSGNYMSVFTIDGGTSSGIKKDMPVVTDDGVVGYIADAGSSWAKVVTLVESTSAIGATVERTGESGLVSGSYTLAADGLCRMTYLAADSEIEKGDRILTSGYGSVYPEGLVIGFVDSVELDDYSQTKVAYVRLSSSLSELTKVMIITSYDKRIEE